MIKIVIKRNQFNGVSHSHTDWRQIMDYYLLFHLLAATTMLIIGIRAGVMFLKWRTKYNLATLIIIAILFLGIILSFFYPGRLNSMIMPLLNKLPDTTGVGIAVRILLVVIFMMLLCVFFFFHDIERFFNRRKKKNK